MKNLFMPLKKPLVKPMLYNKRDAKMVKANSDF